jgi:PAS domain S-box-containing protein
MFIAWGPELRLLYNDGYSEILGDKHPHAVGAAFEDVWPEIWDEIRPLVDRALKGEATYWKNLPLTMRRKGFEEQTWFTFSYSPLRDDRGEVAGMFCACVETTDSVLAEQAVRESEERFRLIADSAPVPMWVTRLDRKRSFVNRAYVEFLGISYEEAVDFDWRTIIHPEDAPRILSESVAGEASLKPFVLEGRYRGGKGGWRWVRSTSQPRLGTGGEHLGFIGVAHDVTDSKEAEAALRELNEQLERRVEERTADLSAALDHLQAEVGERVKAEEALRQAQKMEAVGQLTGGIAHDFNNLLTPVIGGLELIASKIGDERLKRMAETALESARRGAKLTSQLLAFSRIQRISMAPVAVNDVIANMKDLLRHTIGSAIAIETNLDPKAGQGICDANQLENALLNLAINARDAMEQGGRLTISTGRVREDGPDLAPGDYLRISVADTGAGMAPEVRARATEPFFSTKPLGKGTGLGLAQVYGIAQQSGGTVRIQSEVGKGTIVHLLVPAASEARQPSENAAGDAAERRGASRTPAKILVVDDDADVRSFLTESLESFGHVVLSAETGAEGLRRLEQARPDLMLVDYAMPGMHGADVARSARAARPEVRILFVTGYAETDQLDAAMGGRAAVLRKPFTISDLAEAVDSALAPSP